MIVCVRARCHDRFEHLIGELAIAAAARVGGDVTHAQMKAIQGVRVEKLAINLRAVLQRYVAGDEEGFKVRAYVHVCVCVEVCVCVWKCVASGMYCGAHVRGVCVCVCVCVNVLCIMSCT